MFNLLGVAENRERGTVEDGTKTGRSMREGRGQKSWRSGESLSKFLSSRSTGKGTGSSPAAQGCNRLPFCRSACACSPPGGRRAHPAQLTRYKFMVTASKTVSPFNCIKTRIISNIPLSTFQ